MHYFTALHHGIRRLSLRSRSAFAAASLLAVTGCGATDKEPLQGPQEPGESPMSPGESPKEEAKAGGFPEEMLPDRLAPDLPLVAPKTDLDIAIFTDIVDVGPGEDVTFCTYTDVILDEPTIFGETFGAQSPGGHHAVMQYATTAQEPHTGRCGDDMDAQIMLGGTGGKGVADEPNLPENYGAEVPAGAQLVINHHWINTTTEDIEGQSMLLARRLERGGDTVLAGSFPMVAFGWEIPAQGKLEYTTECTYEEDVEYVLALGHMHEWGQHVSIEVERAGGDIESLIDEDWTPEAATTVGGGTIFSLEDPYTIHKGDTVRLTCEWANDTPDPIGFPREMCIFFGYTIGSNYFCANGTWLTPDEIDREQAQQVIDGL